MSDTDKYDCWGECHNCSPMPPCRSNEPERTGIADSHGGGEAMTASDSHNDRVAVSYHLWSLAATHDEDVRLVQGCVDSDRKYDAVRDLDRILARYYALVAEHEAAKPLRERHRNVMWAGCCIDCDHAIAYDYAERLMKEGRE